MPLTTIDSFEFEHAHVMKIDAEGMELQVLMAQSTRRRCRPVIYVEFIKADRELLRQKIAAENYVLYVNGINFLCIPGNCRVESDSISTGTAATRPESSPPNQLGEALSEEAFGRYVALSAPADLQQAFAVS